MNHKQPAIHCPLLVQDDYLVLCSDASMRGATLYDAPLRASHALSAGGMMVVHRLGIGVRYASLLRKCERRTISREQLCMLLGTLNTCGLLVRKRTWRGRVTALRIILRDSLFGIRYAPLTKRRSASVASLVRCTLHATSSVGIASCVSIALVLGTGAFTPRLIIEVGSVAYLMLVASLVAHEAAHVYLLRRHATESVSIHSGMRLGLLHPAQPAIVEKRVALAGPASGIASCLAIAGPLSFVGHSATALACLVVASFHLGSLLPWYADGAALRATRKAQPCLK
jgi:hypothetical protein